MKEFITASTDALDEDEPDEGTTFKLDGREMTAFKPVDGQYAVYMAEVAGRRVTINEKVAGTTNFFIDLFRGSDRTHLVDRLLDPEDKFGVVKIQEILMSLAEEWGGRPTRPSTGSTQSRRNGGRKSTATTPALISSASQ